MPRITRRRVIGAVVAVLLALRIALPHIVRSQIEQRATAAVQGRVTVGDVDLWLLRGAVAVKNVAVRADDAARGARPLVAFRRLYVNVAYFPFLRRTARVQDFALDGLTLNAERLKDGRLVLPAPRPTPAAEPAPAPAATGKPWNVVVDRAALTHGRFRLRDDVAEPPEKRELGLDALTLSDLSLQYGEGARPAHGTIVAKFGDGLVRLKTRVARRPEGFAPHARLEIVNVPLDRAQVHVPELGWRDFGARLDAMLHLHAEPTATPTVSGTLAVRDLHVQVPDDPEPALAWRRLDVAIHRLEPIARHALVDRVALDGGRIVVTPRAPTVLPILPRRKDAAPPPTEAAPAAPATPWTWKVGTVEVTDTTAHVLLEPPPLALTIAHATIRDASSEPGSRTAFTVELHEGDGVLGLDGTAALDPLATTFTARFDHLALERLAAASGAVPVKLPGGVLGGEIAVAAEPAPLVVHGNLTLDDLRAVPPDGEDFSAAWKGLELGIREIRVPGVLRGPAAADEPLRVDLEKLRLVTPAIVLTRTADGIVLPVKSAPPLPADAPPPTPGRPLALALGTLVLEKGDVSVTDRTVKPFYRGEVSAIGLDARGLRFPEGTFEQFALDAMLPGKAPLAIKGKEAKGTIDVDGSFKRVPLAQLNPYVTQAAGLSIARGAASLGSRVHVGTGSYNSKSEITLDQLTLGGAQGDSLFAQHFGVPLSLALGLLRDVHGRIALTVPVTGDRARGMHIDVGAIAMEALQHAIVNALASPLKLLGAVNLSGGKVEGFAPEPVPFPPGRAVLASDATARVAQVGSALAGSPALRLELHGSAGPDDARALSEAAVLADLEK
ncbi:MAG TPA: DUF748 domain-containing protein, partial [Candidatus Binatia bacterium]|nr:DUF748 domain-containing protein [Candidatus Binatia bacterium]